MTAGNVQEMYERHYAGDRARRGLFDALASWDAPERVLYPGSFIHVTASFVFPSVTYVDNDRNANRFFSQMEAVREWVRRHKVYSNDPDIHFHSASYEEEIDEPDQGFDLLLSLFAGFISQPCKRYLAVGGLLAVNDSHGDAGLANLDRDYTLVGVLDGPGDRLQVHQESLQDYFRPKKETPVTEAYLRQLGRGLAYRKGATAYLFRRIR